MIPYTDNSAHVEDDFCTERRLKETINFIRPEDMQGRVLDIGTPNHVGRAIGNRFQRFILNTSDGVDFNVYGSILCGDPPDTTGTFHTILCLEVLEHIMNPANFLQELYFNLKDNGVLYLSTPVRNRYGFMFNETAHFNEYSVSAVKTCLEYSGFRVTDTHLFKSIPFWRGMKHGGGLFRTALRVSSQYTQIHRAVRV